MKAKKAKYIVYEVEVSRLDDLPKPVAERIVKKLKTAISLQKLPLEPVIFLKFSPRIPNKARNHIFFHVVTAINKHSSEPIAVTDSESLLPDDAIRIRI